MAEQSVVDPPSYHFIGVGGIGMSALAYVLAGQGYRVSGSDLAENSCTKRLHSLGVKVYNGQRAENIEEQLQQFPQTSIVRSTAIKSTNPEFAAALSMGVSVLHRSDILAQLMNNRPSIAVAGTHGKTTTSSMLAAMLLHAGLDPTAIIGGEVKELGGNARLGQGEYLVAEADESDGSLVKLKSTYGIITNIELDHPDHFKTLDEVVDVFQTFVANSQKIVASLDCPTVSSTIPVDIGYSLQNNPEADYWAQDIRALDDGGTSAEIWERGMYLGTLKLQLLGEHNVSNAMAAIAIGRQLGLDFDRIAAGLASFGGARRRFELISTVGSVQFIDDYAHHPSEIQATLTAARSQNRRVVAVFQPHRYSRVASLFQEFATSFGAADLVTVVPTYPAGEKPRSPEELELASTLAEAIATHVGVDQVSYEADLKQLPETLSPKLLQDDLVLFLGAGHLNRMIPDIAAAYQDRAMVYEAIAS